MVLPKAVAGSSQYIPVGHANTQSIGAFIEWRETQLVMIGLILLDILTATIGMFLDLNRQIGDQTIPVLFDHILELFSGFTLFVFLIELTALIWVFQLTFFSHFGYCIDFGVIVIVLTWELQRQSKAFRLLGVLRLWRVFRWIETILNEERSLHAITTAALEEEKLVVEKHQMKIQVLEDSLQKEYAAQTQLNRTLQDYKDEIDTLNEALSIAAMSVTTQGLIESDDDVYIEEELIDPEDGDTIRQAVEVQDEFMDALDE